MKKKITAISLLALCLVIAVSCRNRKSEVPADGNGPEMKRLVDEYDYFDLRTDLSGLSENDRQLLPIFFRIGQIMDDLFWEQTFGDKSLMDTISDPWMKEFALINYGPWDRLRNDAPFVPGYGPKSPACRYYPQDMTREEFEALADVNKNSHYTVLRRDAGGKLVCRWYHEEYADKIGAVCTLLDSAIAIADDPGMREYLTARKKALQTDDYFESDKVWMDMKQSKLDFVFGPIENYDDQLNSVKTSYEAFVLVKDEEQSKNLSGFVQMLPQLQNELPCDPKYKTYVPGTSSDMNVYDVVYYGGDCNAGGKTIAINLPNDDRVQAEKGSRRFQLRNAMQAKFDKIMKPIGELLVEPSQLQHLKFDAFFWDVTFHEVGHGLGVKTTVNGKGPVDQAMKTEDMNWEEAKADILGLYLVCNLIDKGLITNITCEDAITSFIIGLFRSVRFGMKDAHGVANTMCYNYMEEAGAFTRNENGTYHINYGKAREAVDGWIALILKTQGEGDFEFARKYREEHGIILPALQNDLDRINHAGIPRDIRFRQGLDVLGL